MKTSPRVRRPWQTALPLALAATLAGFLASGSSAQDAPANGPREVDPRWHALVNADVTVRPGETIEDATIVIRDGVIVSVQPGGAPPRGARVWDYEGLRIYPGFIDAHVPVDAPKPDAGSAVAGAHWRSNVTPERSALSGQGIEGKAANELRSLGFTAAAISPKGGIFRGQSAVVLIDTEESESGGSGEGRGGGGGDGGGRAAPAGKTVRAAVVAAAPYGEVAFETGGWGGAGPSSEMGAIAIIRQTLMDAAWHAERLETQKNHPNGHEPVAPRPGLEALGRDGAAAPMILFDTRDELQALRAAAIAEEFDRPFALLGSGYEFRRLAPVVATKAPIILPLAFPEAPKAASISEAEIVSLRDLLTWEQAPTNPRRLVRAGATVALTTDKLKKRSDFAANLRKSIEHGLTEDEALAALTTTPAKMLGVDGRLGAVAPGMAANLVVADGPVFAEKTKLRDVWVGGARFEVSAGPDTSLEGAWLATYRTDPPFEGELVIGKDNAVTAKANEKEGKARSVAVRENRISFVLDNEPWGGEGAMTLSAALAGEELLGEAIAADGARFSWSAVRKPAGEGAEEEKKDEGKDGAGDDGAKKPAPPPEELPMPFGAYGLLEKPEAEHLVVVGATIWTSGPDGVIENGELETKDGKIVYVGRRRGGAAGGAGGGARVIDASGKHVTPGMIDCHSHSAISGGVNEYPDAVTAEVRIGDVIEPDDISIYRQLAGGLTAANQLHGSANAIGGQNSVVKWRWGVDRAEEMKLAGAPPGIKFALGENPRAANSEGANARFRYPQSRMGVEALIRDRFVAARDYAREHEAYGKRSAGEKARTMPPRRDIELDAIAEILAGERLVHCHSYRQDEILMLCRMADEFGFRIGTFQHVLEGYKVADAIKKSAIGGSAFSDWWAYKVEVIDAIPEAGAIMHEVGVVVSFNSDSDELARRMNGEAAKAVKYGGVAPAEALKFVTLNPAKQLKVDHLIGSLERGKHADFVIWSGDPLSSMSRCEATYVDGALMFSLESDRAMREHARAERARVVQKLLAESAKPKGKRGGEKEEGKATERPSMIERMAAEARERHYLELLRAGIDPDAHRCGDCGMTELFGGAW